MRASTWNRRLESLWLARKRRSSNDILRNKIPYRFHPVSEFVFGTYGAAFVQAMYEDYLRDPASVGPEWRELFDNGRLADLPVIPTDRSEVIRRSEKGDVPSGAPESTSPISPLPKGASPITGPAARLVTNMT